MIYTVESTLGRGRPIKVLLDEREITKALYLDRRRRVVRRFKTDDNGNYVFTPDRDDLVIEEFRYDHRARVRIVPLPRVRRYMRKKWRGDAQSV